MLAGQRWPFVKQAPEFHFLDTPRTRLASPCEKAGFYRGRHRRSRPLAGTVRPSIPALLLYWHRPALTTFERIEDTLLKVAPIVVRHLAIGDLRDDVRQ